MLLAGHGRRVLLGFFALGLAFPAHLALPAAPVHADSPEPSRPFERRSGPALESYLAIKAPAPITGDGARPLRRQPPVGPGAAVAAGKTAVSSRRAAAPVLGAGPGSVEKLIFAKPCGERQRVCFTAPPSTTPRKVARSYQLTFDDCGAESQIKAVLAAVEERELDAWFFPTGKCREQFPWLVPTLLDKGYTVCNHSYSHAVMTRLSDAGIGSEISRGVGWQATGCHRLRPPYGAWDGPSGRVARIASGLGYSVCLWDIDTRDWAGTSATAMVAMINGRSGTVLMHFHGAHTVEAIRQL